jgi:hypothetical protein
MMRVMVRAPNALAVTVAAVTLVACANKPPQEAPAQEPPGSSARLVSATVLANDCGTVDRAYAKLAENAMHKLVEGCTSVPGKSARFTATLSPGGRIEIVAAVDGGAPQPDVVPICILKNELRHKVPLKQACKLEVRLEEGTLALPDAGSD